MSTDFIPKQDTKYQDWLGNFLTVATANLAAIGLLATEFTGLTSDKASFDAAITDMEAKAAASKAATQKKLMFRKSSEIKARALIKRIQAKVDVTNDLKAQLQITVPGSHPAPPTIPYPPTDLVANIISSGVYELRWKRNDNNSNILFIIEAKTADSAPFIQIFSTPKTSYTHGGNPPGAKISYRVKALRGEIFSEPSNIAVMNE